MHEKMSPINSHIHILYKSHSNPPIPHTFHNPIRACHLCALAPRLIRSEPMSMRKGYHQYRVHINHSFATHTHTETHTHTICKCLVYCSAQHRAHLCRYYIRQWHIHHHHHHHHRDVSMALHRIASYRTASLTVPACYAVLSHLINWLECVCRSVGRLEWRRQHRNTKHIIDVDALFKFNRVRTQRHPMLQITRKTKRF